MTTVDEKTNLFSIKVPYKLLVSFNFMGRKYSTFVHHTVKVIKFDCTLKGYQKLFDYIYVATGLASAIVAFC